MDSLALTALILAVLALVVSLAALVMTVVEAKAKTRVIYDHYSNLQGVDKVNPEDVGNNLEGVDMDYIFDQ